MAVNPTAKERGVYTSRNRQKAGSEGQMSNAEHRKIEGDRQNGNEDQAAIQHRDSGVNEHEIHQQTYWTERLKQLA